MGFFPNPNERGGQRHHKENVFKVVLLSAVRRLPLSSGKPFFVFLRTGKQDAPRNVPVAFQEGRSQRFIRRNHIAGFLAKSLPPIVAGRVWAFRSR